MRLPCLGVIVGLVLWAGTALAALSPNGQLALEQARLAAGRQRWAEVPALLALPLQEDPQHVEAHALLGMADLAGGRLPSAVQRLSWVCARQPGEAVYRLALAKALWASGHRPEARTQAGYAAQLAPGDPNAQAFLREVSEAAAPLAPGTAPGSAQPPPALPAGAPDSSAPPAGGFPTSAGSPALAGSSSGSGGEASDGAPPPAAPAGPGTATLLLRRLAGEIAAHPARDLEILTQAVLATPELVVQPGWETLYRRAAEPRQAVRDEVLRRFLRWRSGDLAAEEFSTWFLTLSLPLETWRKDPLLASLVAPLEEGGVHPLARFFRPKEEDPEDWASALPGPAQEAFLNGRYEVAWAFVTDLQQPDSPQWHYVAARLALELWQTQGEAEDWLARARQHLQQALGPHRWQEEASLLLAEVEDRWTRLQSR
ncbi:MAG: hypothetical protein GX442_08325 [Candidatus Riflebacteria bacterium]|nr:hypothetical protein [Candidatus Riflebacteria bacterium]